MKYTNDISKLVEAVGKDNVKRLREGWTLHCWRNSSPHNWWLQPPRGVDDDEVNLDRTQIRFDFFYKSYNSKKRVISYWGSDSGMPVETTYRLKRKYK